MINGNNRRFTTTANNFLAAPNIAKKSGSVVSRNFQTTADFGNGINTQGGFTVGYNAVGKSAFIGMLDGFLPHDHRLKNKIFRDIYNHDPVAGAAVDLYAIMPFSDFYLTGLKDKNVLEVFHKSIEKMRIKTILPQISRDYLVYGKFIGTTVFDVNDNIFSSIMIQNLDHITITDVPFAGMDPIIDMTIPTDFMKLLANKKDPRVQDLLKNLPDSIRKNYTKGNIPLEPSNTLYIPRRTLAADSTGTSFYERLLPIHLMEKAMIRGSIDQVQRRLRAIMHITVTGDGDDFVPTMENLESIRNLFLSADADPTGAIIVTHSGIQPNEIRDASSFFRADELFEYFNSSKYKALGISEAMITGEANFNAMDATLSLFIENIREYRSMLTRELFYEKIFPAIAYANDFTKDRYMVTGSVSRLGHNGGPIMMDEDGNYTALCSGSAPGFDYRNKMIDTSTLAMPSVSWKKHLRPVGDASFLEMLSQAEQHGVPVPIAMFASATGIEIDAVLNSMDEDKNIRKRIQKYQDMLAEFQNPDQSQGYAAQASAQDRILKALSGTKLKPKGIFNRDYDERYLPHNTDKNGNFKITSAKQRKRLYSKQIKTLAEVIATRQDNERREARAKKKPR